MTEVSAHWPELRIKDKKGKIATKHVPLASCYPDFDSQALYLPCGLPGRIDIMCQHNIVKNNYPPIKKKQKQKQSCNEKLGQTDWSQ